MYGVIDIGSNTIRLMVYRVEDGAIHPVLNKKYATGLVGYINSKGRMSKEGIRKAVEILSELRAVTQQIRLREIFPFATASLRNITNTEEVLQAIQEASGFSVRVLSGQEEATFDYYGAIQSAPPGLRPAGRRGRRQHGAGTVPGPGGDLRRLHRHRLPEPV